MRRTRYAFVVKYIFLLYKPCVFMRCYVTICLYLLNKMFSVINGGLYTREVMEASFCFLRAYVWGGGASAFTDT